MKSVIIIVSILLLIGGFVGVMALLGPEDSDAIWTESSVRGTLVARGQALGDFTLQPTFCRTGSGGTSGFGGATLYVNSPGVGMDLNQGAIEVRYLDDEHHRVTVTIPGSCTLNSSPRAYHRSSNCRSVVIDERDCQRHDVKVHNTGRRVSKNRASYAYAGHAALSCRLAGSGTVQADLVFDNCD
ncbi:MAG: hypothetical protein ABIJ09_13295 [Pseudomonadota bacterium]